MKYPHQLFILYFLIFTCFACNNDANTSKESTPQAAVSQATESNSASPVEPAKATPQVETENEEDNAATKEAIADIQKNYAHIQQQLADGLLRRDTLLFSCELIEDEGMLTRYYDDNELVLLMVDQAFSHSGEGTSIYMKDEQIFFIYEESGYWQFGGPMNEEAPNTIDYFEERRYYVQDGILIKKLVKNWEEKSWEEKPESQNIPNVEEDITAEDEYPMKSALPQLMMGKVDC